MDILALNRGSSSVKYQLFNRERREVVAKGMVEKVTFDGSFIVHEVPGLKTHRQEHECPDHRGAILTGNDTHHMKFACSFACGAEGEAACSTVPARREETFVKRSTSWEET